MANVNSPSGAQPVRTGDGSPWNNQATLYYIPSSNGSQFNIGDFVKSAAGADSNGVMQIAKAAASDTLRGVIVSVVTDPLALQTINIPATKTHDYYVMVCDDPGTVFEMTDDGITSANLVAASVNKNANFTVTNPTAPSPVSASVINSSTIATTQALPLRLLGLKQVEGNGFGAFARWLVRINQHELMGNTAGV